MMAAEMAIIRLTHVADLPSPEELIKKIQNDPNPPVSVRNGPSVASNSENEVPQQKNIQISPNSSGAKLSNDGTIGVVVPRPQEEDPLHKYSEFNQVLELIRSHRDMKLLYDVETYVRVVKYLPGRLEFEPTKESPKDLAQRLGQKLQDWTKSRWAITLVNEGGGATIAEQKLEAKDDLHAKVSSHPLVKATLLAFPNSEIRNVNSINDMNIDEQILQEVPEEGDNWDPFEDN
jgi:DNA polymerase-3 subunit gamma/tau